MNNLKVIFLISLLILVGCSKFEQENLESKEYSKLKPGLYSEKTPGIGEVSGSCVGKIALTPYDKNSKLSYPLVYDCETRNFEILKVPQVKNILKY